MISVCLASYNGSAFIIRQLDSIVSQLQPQDQIILVDDCSTDDTVALVKERYGERIEIHENTENLRSMRSFEKALQYVKGDYVFLADQDDIWLENKVERVMQAFEKERADVVVHDAIVVDGDLNVLDQSWNARNGNKMSQGKWGNILKNAYTGCMMAFKKEFIQDFLPLPATIEMHDQWMALVAMTENKKIVVIDEPLMEYVRHGGNVTAVKKRSIGEQLKGRIGTIKAIHQYQKNRNEG